MSTKPGWAWIYHPPTARESGRLDLTPPSGIVAATVFTGRSGSFGHCWYVWDRNGTGGENSAEPTVDEAVVEAEKAVERWGQVTG